MYDNRVFLALGSNIDPVSNLKRALSELNRAGIVRKLSPFYETRPWGEVEQPNYINCAVEFWTNHSPQKLLLIIKELESRLGRVPTVRWGSRTIDVDIILFGGIQINVPGLCIPHAEMEHRDFVLKPLSCIAARVIVPKTCFSVSRLYEALEERLKTIVRVL